jgi:excisionase family DNA binding protein
VNELMDVKQAAALLGLKVSTIRAWLARRRLPFVRCGRAIRIRREALERFITENTVPARESRRC